MSNIFLLINFSYLNYLQQKLYIINEIYIILSLVISLKLKSKCIHLLYFQGNSLVYILWCRPSHNRSCKTGFYMRRYIMLGFLDSFFISYIFSLFLCLFRVISQFIYYGAVLLITEAVKQGSTCAGILFRILFFFLFLFFFFILSVFCSPPSPCFLSFHSFPFFLSFCFSFYLSCFFHSICRKFINLRGWM